MVSYITAFAEPEAVLVAAGITTLLIFSLVVYALKTNNDITLKVNLIFYSFYALIALIIVSIFIRDFIV